MTAASLVVYVALTQATTALAAALVGVMDAAALLRVAWLALLYMAGTWAGAALFQCAPESVFRWIAAGAVLLLGGTAAVSWRQVRLCQPPLRHWQLVEAAAALD